MNIIIVTVILMVKKSINADYSALSEKIRPILSYLNLRVVIE